MDKKDLLMGLFEKKAKLGKGGMGAVYDVRARPDIAEFEWKHVLADMVAWREATGEEQFEDFYKPIHSSRKKIDRLVSKEKRLHDKKAGSENIKIIKKQLSNEKKKLIQSIKGLKNEQVKYVNSHKKELVKNDISSLVKELKSFKINLPKDNRFALKVDTTGQSEYLRRLQDEWKSLITMNHKNLIGVFSGGNNYYLMEFIQNKLSYKNILNELNIGQRVKIIRDAAKGLSAAHKNGIIHRDLKPDNLFVYNNKSGVNVKVGDFGLAKTEIGMTMTGQTLGTPFYMPPEQINDVKGCNETADIYSLGGALYAFITGEAPFKRTDFETAYELLRKIETGEAELASPKKIEKTVPDDLEDITMTMMEREPSQRFQSMDEVIDVLGKYLQVEHEEVLNTRSFTNLKSIKNRSKKVTVRKRKAVSSLTNSLVERKGKVLGYAAGGIAALGLAGYLLFGGGENSKEPVKDPAPVVEQDYSNVETMFEKLQKGYDSGLHSRLVEAVGKVPDKKRSEFEGYLEKADDIKKNFEFGKVKSSYDELKEEYYSLKKNPDKTGISSLKEKVDSLKGKIEDLEVDASSLKLDFEFDKLEKVIENYDSAKAELAKAEGLAEKSKDKRYSSDIEGIKRDALESVKGTEETSLYNPLVSKIKEINLAENLPGLMVDFENEEDLKYFKKTFTASGKVEDGKFNGMFRPKGMCSFYFKGELDGDDVEGPVLSENNKLIVYDDFGNNKEYKVNLIKGEVDDLVYRK